MDPAAALTEAFSSYQDGDIPTSADRLYNYLDWRKRGGFEPKLPDLPPVEGIERHSCCSDHAAQWLLILIKRKLEEAELGISFCSLTPDIVDMIGLLLGDTDEKSICPSCNGSGEGRTENEKCSWCHGEGEV